MVVLLAPRPEGMKGGHLGEIDVFLQKRQLREWVLDITHQCMDHSRFGCMQWPTVPSTWSTTTGNRDLICDFYDNWSLLLPLNPRGPP